MFRKFDKWTAACLWASVALYLAFAGTAVHVALTWEPGPISFLLMLGSLGEGFHAFLQSAVVVCRGRSPGRRRHRIKPASFRLAGAQCKWKRRQLRRLIRPWGPGVPIPRPSLDAVLQRHINTLCAFAAQWKAGRRFKWNRHRCRRRWRKRPKLLWLVSQPAIRRRQPQDTLDREFDRDHQGGTAGSCCRNHDLCCAERDRTQAPRTVTKSPGGNKIGLQNVQKRRIKSQGADEEAKGPDGSAQCHGPLGPPLIPASSPCRCHGDEAPVSAAEVDGKPQDCRCSLPLLRGGKGKQKQQGQEHKDLIAQLAVLLANNPGNLLQELKSLVQKATKQPSDAVTKAPWRRQRFSNREAYRTEDWNPKESWAQASTNAGRANSRWGRWSEWSTVQWQIRKEDWEAGQDPLYFASSPDELARQLDDQDDGAWLVQVPSVDQAVDVMHLIGGSLQGRVTVVLTDAQCMTVADFPQQLQDFAPGATRTKVSGKLGTQIQCRTCWVLTLGENPPSLRAKKATPFKVPARANDHSHVLRVSFQWRFAPKAWEQVRKRPGDMFRKWLGAVAPGALEEMKIAYPTLLFDRNIIDGRGMMCSFLTLAIGNNQGRELSRYGRCRVRQDLRLLPAPVLRLYDGPAVNVEDMWRILGKGTSNGGLVVGTIIKPKLGLQPKPFGEACYAFWQGGDFIKNDEPQRNQVFCQMRPVLGKLFSANITADDPNEMIARGKYCLSQFGPLSENCAFLVDGYVAGGTAVTCARRNFPKQFLHYHRAGHGSVTSPQTQRGYTAFVHTKISRVIGASGIHTGTMSFGKMEGDASDKNIAFMLQDDEADGPYYRQEWEGMKQTTPIISGGMNALRLPAFFENLGHSNVILTAGGGSFGHKDGPKPGAISCRQGEEAWKAWKAGQYGNISLSDGVIEFAKTHEEIKGAFLTFQKDADQIYPGWKEKLGYTGESSVQAASFDWAKKA
ncbi:rbcL [Symbiodinium sp. CCMP2592]|nr:rbcL [Symbiodinium sp. CCMP2592]